MSSRRRQLVFENLPDDRPRLCDKDSEADLDGDSLGHTDSEPGTENSTVDASMSGVKSERGLTRSSKMWTSNDKHAVTYDPLGHPISGAAQKLITFLGTVAHKGSLLPIDVPRWKLLELEKIDNAWHEITKRFSTDHPNAKIILLKLLRKKWNDWKVSLERDFFIPGDRAMTLEGPFQSDNPRVDEDQWAILVEYWMSPEFQAKIKRRKLEASASGITIETPGPNDILAQTLGKDPPGRVRAMGWAATASNTWGAKAYGNTE